MNESSVTTQSATYLDALQDAADQLGVHPRELAVEVLDPGRSANSMGGFRPVRIRAWRRDSGAPPDGAGRGEGPKAVHGSAPGGPRASGFRGGRRPSGDYGPPPPPLDPAKITPVLVSDIRVIVEELVGEMGFAATVSAEKTSEGVRAEIVAGDKDQFLIGRDGEALAAMQHLVARILRARTPDDTIPRIELDVAGYRERRVQALRDLARELIQEVQATGEEASTEPLSAIERRVIHLEVAANPGLMTLSVGDGLYKRVIIGLAESDGGERSAGR